MSFGFIEEIIIIEHSCWCRFPVGKK